jgi:hypothetical protein
VGFHFLPVGMGRELVHSLNPFLLMEMGKAMREIPYFGLKLTVFHHFMLIYGRG